MPFPADLPAEIAADLWRLRLLSDADWKLAWSMSRDPEVVRWTLYPPEMTENAAHRRGRRITESANQRLSGHYAVLDAGHAAIGTAGIASSDGDPAAAEVLCAVAAGPASWSGNRSSPGVDGVGLLRWGPACSAAHDHWQHRQRGRRDTGRIHTRR